LRNSAGTTECVGKESADKKTVVIQPKEKITADLALDISSCVVGFALLDYYDNSMIMMDHIKLDSKKNDNIFDKADFALSELKLKLANMDIKRIFVEAHAKVFANGGSSADTLFTLAKINALISYLMKKHFNVPLYDINVLTARSKIGYKNNRKDKRKTKEKLREYILVKFPELPIKKHIVKNGKNKGLLAIDKEVEDELDAFVLCYSGRILYPPYNL
jgi:hypothetical protein